MSTQLSSDALKSLSESVWLQDKASGYVRQHRYDMVAELAGQALEKRKAAMGAEDPGVGELLHMLGVARMNLGACEEAHKYFGEALAIFEKHYYDSHFSLGPVLSDEATCYMAEGRYEEAEPVCDRALQIFSKTLSGEHRLTLEATYKLAFIYRQNGKRAEALKLFTRAKKNFDTPLGPIEELKFLEALILEADEKPAEAEKAFLEAIDLFEMRRSLGRLGHCWERYAEFLESQGRADEAGAAREKGRHFSESSDGLSRSSDIFPSTLLRA